MQFNNKAAIPFLLLFVMAVSACTGSDAPGPVSSNGQGPAGILCQNSLLPAKNGATWVYSSIGGPVGTFTYTDTITSTRADGFTITSQFNGVTRTQEWTCQSEGLRTLQLGGGIAAGISTLGITGSFTTVEINGVSLPKEILPGMSWVYSLKMQGTLATPGDSQSPASGVYFVTMQEVGRETITVPAGTFEAVKIQGNSTIDILSPFEGVEVSIIKFNGTTISWYAPGIGFIKSVEIGDFGGTTYSATTELQSYSIP